MKASVLLVGIVIACPARAEFEVQVGGGYRYEDNLFRLPSGPSIIPGVRKGDRIGSINAEVDGDFHPGDFDGTLTGTIAHDWYQRNAVLNNLNYTLATHVERKPGATIGVTFDAESDRRLSSFSDLNARVRNIQSFQQVGATVTLPISADIRVVAIPDFRRSTNSSSAISINDFNQYGGGIGLGYYSPIGNSIAVTVSRHHTDGVKDRFVVLDGTIRNANIDLDDTSVDLRLTYLLSTFTAITGVISYTDRNDKSVLNDNYHGPSGKIAFDYTPRPSFNVHLEGGRRLETQNYLFIDSVRDDYATGSIAALIRDNVQAELLGDFEHRRFKFDPLISATQGDRVENIYRVTASVTWTVVRRVRLGLSGYHEQRSANYEFGDYKANGVQATATIVFGRRSPTLRRSLTSGYAGDF